MTNIPIGKLSNATGVGIETIRYYERINLVPTPDRTDSGHRRYDDEHVARLRFIKRARELGFSLDEVRSLIGLEDEPPSCSEVYEITARHLEQVRTRIRDLKRLETMLTEASKSCATSNVPTCPVIEALSTAAE